MIEFKNENHNSSEIKDNVLLNTEENKSSEVGKSNEVDKSNEVFSINNNENNPSAQFYSLIIDGIEAASIKDDKISISVNFISEQMLNNDEGSISKNSDTWTFEKPINSSSPQWTLTQT